MRRCSCGRRWLYSCSSALALWTPASRACAPSRGWEICREVIIDKPKEICIGIGCVNSSIFRACALSRGLVVDTDWHLARSTLCRPPICCPRVLVHCSSPASGGVHSFCWVEPAHEPARRRVNLSELGCKGDTGSFDWRAASSVSKAAQETRKHASLRGCRLARGTWMTHGWTTYPAQHCAGNARLMYCVADGSAGRRMECG